MPYTMQASFPARRTKQFPGEESHEIRDMCGISIHVHDDGIELLRSGSDRHSQLGDRPEAVENDGLILTEAIQCRHHEREYCYRTYRVSHGIPLLEIVLFSVQEMKPA